MTAALDDRLTAIAKQRGPLTMDSSGAKADGQMSAITGETIYNNPGQPTAAATAPL